MRQHIGHAGPLGSARRSLSEKEPPMADQPRSGLQLRSLVKGSGELELSLATVDAPAPAADEVVVRMEASPINPSDLGLLLGPADLTTLKAADGKVTANVPQRFL